MKTLCVTGHRPDSLPWKKDTQSPLCKDFILSLKQNIKFAIANGCRHFIAGGALGVDTLFALTVIELKDEGEDITLEIAVPCKTQAQSWSEANKSIYSYILSRADEVTYLAENYYVFCMQKRNEYMVNKSDCVLCCYNGKKSGGTYNTIKLAQKMNKKLLYVEISETPKNGGNQIIMFIDNLV